jgi:hypothetical protein
MRVARATLIVLALATFVAFFVTQRLKGSPPVVRQIQATAAFSPVAPGVRNEATLSFQLEEPGRVSVDIVNEDGDLVRELAINREAGKHQTLRFKWDGRDADGNIAPDGIYRPQVVLEDQSRAVTLPAPIRLDTEPPKVVVTDVRPKGPGGEGPGVWPRANKREIRVIFRGPARRRPEFLVYRTGDGVPRLVHQFKGKVDSRVGRWDGRINGRPAPEGTYLIAVRARDQAGNPGTAPPVLPPARGEVEGHPGLEIRYLAATPPVEPIVPGGDVVLRVESAGRPYTWKLRRAARAQPLNQGSGDGSTLRISVPAEAEPGPYFVELRSGRHVARAPFVVRAPAERDPRPRVLVVLPAITWAGQNPVDDTGKGFPDTLLAGDDVKVQRPFTDLPVGWVPQIVPLQRFLERENLAYDVTSDLALARGIGPKLADYRGAVLAAGLRWLTPELQLALREFVEDGGNVMSMGVEALRRRVNLVGGWLRDPRPPASEDMLGSRLEPFRARPVEVLAFEDKINLFRGTSGSFPGFSGYEVTGGIRGGRLLAGAGPSAEQPVIVSYRLGKGLVIRYGLQQWTRRLTPLSQESTVTRRAWSLISR